MRGFRDGRHFQLRPKITVGAGALMRFPVSAWSNFPKTGGAECPCVKMSFQKEVQ